MNTAIRPLALLAALAVCAGASAGTVTLDIQFDNFNGTPANELKQPVPVNDVAGLRFSGAYGYHTSMLGNEDFLPGGNRPPGGFIMNRDRPTGSSQNPSFNDVVISVAKDAVARTSLAATPAAVSAAAVFTNLSFVMFSGATAPTWEAFNDAGDRVEGGNLAPGDNRLTWSNPLEFSINRALGATRLVFNTQDRIFGLDGMRITLDDPGTGGGGDVPEPASYALVGLALLAAGAARRKAA